MKTQKEMIEIFMPILEESGKVYCKKTLVLARAAHKNEVVHTYTSDGKETSNKAKEGDYRVKNLTDAGEEYLLSESKLNSRYVLHKDLGIWSLYKATGKVIAIEYSDDKYSMGNNTEFEASWGESMKLKDGDYLASPLPDKNEVYRIARKEFEETYGQEKEV